MTVFTSAKSKLMKPGLVISSEMPRTPCATTSSTTLNASDSGVRRSMRSFKRSLVITINESTDSDKACNPSAAKRPRFGPSHLNGRVTTATVNAPCSLAIRATTGAAPLPVPPPIPAVITTISAPAKALAISSVDSSAALVPRSGFEPAPKPPVNLGPI